MKNLIALVAIPFLVLSCGGKGGSSSSPTKQQNPITDSTETVNVPDYFVIEKTYMSDQLVMIYPSSNHWGSIKVEGVEGQKLFESLRVSALRTEGNPSYMPGLVKNGKHVKCSRTSMVVEPDVYRYSCVAFMNYKNGTLIQNAEYTGTEKSLPPSAVEFECKTLAVSAKDQTATVTLRRKDSKALYYTLDIREVGTDKFERKANMVDCLKSTNTNLYACSVNLNLETGAHVSSN